MFRSKARGIAALIVGALLALPIAAALQAPLVTAPAASALIYSVHGVARPYAGKPDAKHYDGSLFHGDKAKFEQALAVRVQGQDEYVRMGGALK